MRCVTPMFRRYNPYKDNDKGQIVRREEVLGELNFEPNHIRFCLDKMNDPERIRQTGHKYQQIPCGKCYACKLNYSAQWATRLTLEAKDHENNYFITLTYDDDHIVQPNVITDGTEIYKNDGTWNGTLVKAHPSNFIRRLREYFRRKGFKEKIIYYYCGEYGGETKRPHYHLILLNCPLDIKEFYDFHMDKKHKMHWKSKEIERYWNKGIVDIAEVEWSSCAYVARYCMKKLTDSGEPKEYYTMGKIPEFVRMSTHPAIGSKYYNEHKHDIYKNDELIMRTVKGNVGSVKPPKAWDKKFKEEFPNKWKEIQESRLEAAERARKMKERLTATTDKKQLEFAMKKVVQKAKMLPRDMTEN